MTEIQFYHLLTTPMHRALPKLMEKALASGGRSVVLVNAEAVAEQLDQALWDYDPNRFLPHGTMKDPQPERQPIYITTRAENPNGATILVVTDGSQCEQFDGFHKVLDLFDGHDEQAVTQARTRWQAYKDAGLRLNYIQQQKGGGWKSMATANQPDEQTAIAS